MLRDPGCCNVGRAKEVNEVTEVHDDISIESPLWGEERDDDSGRVYPPDAIWPDLQRDLLFGHRADGLDPCRLAEDTGNEQAIPRAPRVEDASADDEAVRGHLHHGEAAEPDNGALVITENRPLGHGVPDCLKGTGDDIGEPGEGNGMPLAEQTVEDDGDLLANRVEPRYCPDNLVRQFGDFLRNLLHAHPPNGGLVSLHSTFNLGLSGNLLFRSARRRKRHSI